MRDRHVCPGQRAGTSWSCLAAMLADIYSALTLRAPACPLGVAPTSTTNPRHQHPDHHHAAHSYRCVGACQAFSSPALRAIRPGGVHQPCPWSGSSSLRLGSALAERVTNSLGSRRRSKSPAHNAVQ